MRKFTSKDLLAARTGPERKASEERHIAPFQAAIDFFRLNVGRGRSREPVQPAVDVPDAGTTNPTRKARTIPGYTLPVKMVYDDHHEDEAFKTSGN